MSKLSETLIITRTGQARGLVGPLVDKITRQLGADRSIRRASNVEPAAELSQTALLWLGRNRPDLIFCMTLNDTHEDVRDALQSDLWWADMHPCGQEMVLGPFETREAALQAEHDWLLAHGIPTADLAGR